MITFHSEMESDWENTVSSTICRTLCDVLSSTDLYSSALHSYTSKPQSCYISLVDYLHQRSSILLSCTWVFHQVECYAHRLITGTIYIHIPKRNTFFFELTFGFSEFCIYIRDHFAPEYVEWEKVRARSKPPQRNSRSPTLYGNIEGFGEKVNKTRWIF